MLGCVKIVKFTTVHQKTFVLKYSLLGLCKKSGFKKSTTILTMKNTQIKKVEGV